MGKTLSTYAIQMMGNQSSVAFVSPFLVWSAPPGDVPEELILATQAAGHALAPRHGEPVIFELKKEKGKANPFAMGVTVGRNENNDIVLDHPSISRFHAYFQQDLRTQQWKLVDAESKNGTWCGPLKLKPNQGQFLADNTKLRFGDLELQFMNPETFKSYLRTQMG